MQENIMSNAYIEMFKTGTPYLASWFTVKAVNRNTCNIYDKDKKLNIEGVFLCFDSSDFFEIPKLNTDVLVIFTDSTYTKGLVVKCEQTESIVVNEYKFFTKSF